MEIIGQLWSIIVDEEVRINLRKDIFSISFFLACYMNVEVGAPQAME